MSLTVLYYAQITSKCRLSLPFNQPFKHGPVLLFMPDSRILLTACAGIILLPSAENAAEVWADHQQQRDRRPLLPRVLIQGIDEGGVVKSCLPIWFITYLL